MSTKEIDEQIAALEKEKASFTDRLSELKNADAELARQEDSLRTRSIRLGDIDASKELDALRLMVDFSGRESADLAAEISKIDTEIAGLRKQREIAATDELFDVFVEQGKLAIKEAAEIELHLAAFAKAIAPHKDRLARLSMLARNCNLNRVVDGRHLWRRIGAVLHQLSPFENSRQHKAYNEPYPEILRDLLEATGRNRQPEGDPSTVAANQ